MPSKEPSRFRYVKLDKKDYALDIHTGTVYDYKLLKQKGHIQFKF